MDRRIDARDGIWPELALEDWRETRDTLHMWSQIIGKIRMEQSPWINHGWHVPLYVTARGLTTSLVPHPPRAFSVDFDFVDHRLVARTSDGRERALELRPQSTADFYAAVMEALAGLDVPVAIRTTPNEVADAIPFDRDRTHASYDREAARRFWRALVQIDRVFQAFRARFCGKCSPVHFFWGSFDLAVTRFSGRLAPPHPGGVPNFPDWAAREAYSHEVSSCGFWTGGGGYDAPAFYSYAYPAPDGFAEASVRPAEASYSEPLGEFLLPYDAVRRAPDPDSVLLEFLQSTYEAAADLGRWDRRALEYGPPAQSARIRG